MRPETPGSVAAGGPALAPVLEIRPGGAICGSVATLRCAAVPFCQPDPNNDCHRPHRLSALPHHQPGRRRRQDGRPGLRSVPQAAVHRPLGSARSRGVRAPYCAQRYPGAGRLLGALVRPLPPDGTVVRAGSGRTGARRAPGQGRTPRKHRRWASASTSAASRRWPCSRAAARWPARRAPWVRPISCAGHGSNSRAWADTAGQGLHRRTRASMPEQVGTPGRRVGFRQDRVAIASPSRRSLSRLRYVRP